MKLGLKKIIFICIFLGANAFAQELEKTEKNRNLCLLMMPEIIFKAVLAAAVRAAMNSNQALDLYSITITD